jgi:hypothetical protein
MRARIKKWLGGIKEFHRTRLISNITSHSKEEYENNVRNNFDAAKRLSDFVGMIVRFAFLQAALSYFMRKAVDSPGATGYVLGFCAVSVFGLLIALGIRIFYVILLYEASDIHRDSRRWVKYALFVFALAHSVALWYGMRVLVSDLTRSAPLGSM